MAAVESSLQKLRLIIKPIGERYRVDCLVFSYLGERNRVIEKAKGLTRHCEKSKNQCLNCFERHEGDYSPNCDKSD